MFLEKRTCKLTGPKKAIAITFYKYIVLIQLHKLSVVAKMVGNTYLQGQGSLMILRMLATIFSLEHAQVFILGCTELVISTDYKPLLGFLNNSQDISSIVNPCISNFKQKTRRYQFTTQYNPSKWQGLN